MAGRQVNAADGGVLGNVYDKYGTSNPVARRLMNGFLAAVGELYGLAAPSRVLEVGCGEGRLADHLFRTGPSCEHFEASDVSLEELADGLDERIRFTRASVYELPYDSASFDLVICCEVLEHLEDPQGALAEIRRVASRNAIFSTPREPLWRVLNILRGKYIGAGGNTPGHIQHFGRASLVRLVRREFTVREVRTPLPWTMLLAGV